MTRPLGVATLDRFGNGQAAIRGVTVSEDQQGRGYGRKLLTLVEAFAKERQTTQLCVNADAEKTGFYERLGFVPHSWGEIELEDFRAGRAWPTPVQMVKRL